MSLFFCFCAATAIIGELSVTMYCAPCVAHSGQLTQRDNQHPGYYRGKLLNMEQRGIIAFTREQYQHDGTNYICTLTFVSTTTMRQFKFQSERPLKSKAEAKESAAKKAVLSLGIYKNE